MTIENYPPFVTDRTKLKPSELEFHTKDVRDGDGEFVPGRRIIAHYGAISDALHGKVNNTYYGRLFEICFWEALVRYGVSPFKIEHHVDLSNGLHAEADLLVGTSDKPIPLLLKTSLRERWKQIDRDALVMRNGNHELPCAVFYREHKTDTAERMITHAQRIGRMFASRADLITVMDESSMRELFMRCGARE